MQASPRLQTVNADRQIAVGRESYTRFPLNDSDGKHINHPANLAAIYEFVASERGMPIAEFAVQMEQNFLRLAGIYQ